MSDDEILSLFREYKRDPSAINNYRYRNACLRAGDYERVGFETGDFVEVDERGSDYPWTVPPHVWTGYISHFRLLHWQGEEKPDGYSMHIIPSPPLYGKLRFEHRSWPRIREYIKEQGGLLITGRDKITVVKVANPESKKIQAIYNGLTKLIQKFHSEMYTYRLTQYGTTLSWSEWKEQAVKY